MGKQGVGVAGAAMMAMLAGAAGCSGHGSPASPGSGGAGGGPVAAGSGATGSAVTGTGGVTSTPAGGSTGAGQSPTGCLLPTAPAGTWVEIPAPPGAGSFQVSDAFAAGQDDLLFAGATFDPTSVAPPANARVLSWTRGCWSVDLSIPPGATTPDHPSVHGTGAGDIWASASDVLFHRDAAGWTRFTDESWRNTAHQIPNSQTTVAPIQFNRVRAAAPDDLWVAATSNILHWSGGAWTTYNFDDPGFPNTSAAIGFFFTDIWIDSPMSVWVVGPSEQIGNTMSRGFVHHFDGAGWTHTAAAVGAIDAIWRGGAVLWLAQPSEDEMTIRAFDGATATAAPIAGVDPSHPVFLTNLFGRGANDMWAAGADVAQFDGQAWSLVADAPAPAHSTTGLETNTFVTGDSAATWLVTPGPRFFRQVTRP